MATKTYRISIEADMSKLLNQIRLAKDGLENLGKGTDLEASIDFQNMKKEFSKVIDQMQAELKDIKLGRIDMGAINSQPLDDLLNKLRQMNVEIGKINTNMTKLDFSTNFGKMNESLNMVKQTITDLNNLLSSSNKNRQGTDPTRYIKMYKDVSKYLEGGTDLEKNLQGKDLDTLKQQANTSASAYENLVEEVEKLDDAFQKAKSSGQNTSQIVSQQIESYVKLGNEIRRLDTLLNTIWDKEDSIDFSLNRDKASGLSSFDTTSAELLDWDKELDDKIRQYQNVLAKQLQKNSINPDDVLAGVYDKQIKSLNSKSTANGYKLPIKIDIQLDQEKLTALSQIRNTLEEAQAYAKANPIKISLDLDQEEDFSKKINDQVSKTISSEQESLQKFQTTLKSILSTDTTELVGIDKTEIQSAMNSISSSIENMSIDSVSSINNIITAIEKMVTVMKLGFNLPSDSALDAQWKSIQSLYKQFNKTESGAVDFRNKTNRQIRDELLTQYNQYVSGGGFNTLDDLTKDADLVKKLSNQMKKMSFDIPSVEEESADLLQFKQVLLDMQQVIKEFTATSASFASSADQIAQNLDKIFQGFDSGSTSKVKKAADDFKELGQVLKTTESGSAFSSDDLRSRLNQMFANEKDINSPLDLTVTKDVSKSISQLGEYETALYRFAGTYRNIQDELVHFSGSVNQKGDLLGNIKTELINEKAFSEEVQATKKQIAEAKKVLSDLDKLRTSYEKSSSTLSPTNKTDQYTTDINNVLKNIEQVQQKVYSISSKGLDFINESDIQELTTYKSQLQDLIKQLNAIQTNKSYNLQDKTLGSVVQQNVRDYQTALNYAKQQFSKNGILESDISIKQATDGLATFSAQIRSANNETQTLRYSWDEVAGTIREVSTSKVSSSAFTSDIQKTVNKFNDLDNAIKDLRSGIQFNTKTDAFSQSFDSLLSKIEKIRTEANNILGKDFIDDSDLSLLKSYTNEISDLYKELNKLSKDRKYNLQDSTSGSVLKQNINNLQQAQRTVEELANSQGKLVKDLQVKTTDSNTAKFTATVRDQTGEVKKLQYAWDGMQGTLRGVSTTMQQGTTGLSAFTNSIKDGFVRFGQYFTGDRIISAMIRYTKSGIDQIRQLDDTFTEMKKVSDESVQSLENFSSQSFDIGREIGATGLEIQNSAADWMRLGYNLQDAGKLAQNAALYSNVGDMDIDTATEHLISSVKAFRSEFGNEVEASSAIVDKFNEIGNNFSISSEGLGSSFERSAASLVAAGNSIDEALGLTTAANEIYQDPESVGNALKVVSLRLRGAKTELEDMGESTDGMAESTSKMRDDILALTGIDIMIDDTTFKSTYQILDEISNVWGSLNDITRANVLEQIAGKNRASVVAGLISNFQTARDVVVDAANAEGSAIQENEAHLESISGHLDLLNNKWQEMWANAINRDVINFFIDLGTIILKLVDNIGLLPTVLGGLSFFGMAKGGGRDKTLSLLYTSNILNATEAFNGNMYELSIAL